MTDHDVLYVKIDQQNEVLKELTEQLSKLEEALLKIPIQAKDIEYMTIQINALWKKHDENFGPHGVITKMRDTQAACPAESLKLQIKVLWGAMGSIIMLMIGLKIWG